MDRQVVGDRLRRGVPSLPMPHPRLYLPLRRLVMCLDCEACFDIDVSTCPACGSETLTTLARFLERTSSSFFPSVMHRVADMPHAQESQHLIVVARDQQALYNYLVGALADNKTVRVILDRRRGDTATTISGPQRRRSDRAALVEAQLRASGCAVVVLETPENLAETGRRQPASIGTLRG